MGFARNVTELLGPVGGAASIYTVASVFLVLVMGASWTLLPVTIFGPILIGLIATLTAGFIGTWQALRSPAAPILRNE